MTFSFDAERQTMREHCTRLVRVGGPGWDAYTLTKARTLEKQDPTLHRGLEAAVREAIAARAATTEKP
jgi:hypothetical protein